MSAVLVVLFLHCLLCHFAQASWTQQYGDGGSTSFVPFKGVINLGWWYIGQRASQNVGNPRNPCTSEEGIVFYPLESRVIAVSPEGVVLREYVVQQTDADYYLDTSNTLYSEKLKMVIVFAFGSTQKENGQILSRLSALDPTADRVIWQTDNMYGFSHPLLLSETQELLFIAIDKALVALSLKNGSQIWSKPLGSDLEWPIPLKLATLPSSSGQKKEVLLFPTVPGVYNGILFALDPVTGMELWQQTLGFNEEGSFAISPTGIIYGCTGLFPDVAHGKQIIILEADTGKILYNGEGYCTNASQVMTPSADSYGNGYYSCGNQVFSVTPNGKLRWRSSLYGYEDLPQHLPVSIHPDGTIYYVTINQTSILALSSQDGSLIKSYTGRRDVSINQPPILVGNYMYIVGVAPYTTAVLYPMSR